jgi:hypothetical protein
MCHGEAIGAQPYCPANYSNSIYLYDFSLLFELNLFFKDNFFLLIQITPLYL